FFTSFRHCRRSVNAPRRGVPLTASAMTPLTHLTKAPCRFSLLEPSKVSHGHRRAIAPRTAAIALASLSAEACARQASAACADPEDPMARTTKSTVKREVDIGEPRNTRRRDASSRATHERGQPRLQLVERPGGAARGDRLAPLRPDDADQSLAEGED